uniref:Peroxin-19 n=1 Tax=Triatoma infestans TaxID=30076 RepID=A0A170Z7T6_TRIIF
MSDNNPVEKGVEDDRELEELLDSAIEDFDKRPKSVKEQTPPAVEVLAEDDEWGGEFLVEVQKQFEQNMKALFGQEPSEEGATFAPEQFSAQLQKMAQEANKVLNEHAKNPEFSETIAQTLKNLSENADNLETDLGTNNLSAMMEGLGLGSPDVSNEMLPLIQSVMKSFLSKDMLYGPIKEITEKYPTWLQEHKSNLDDKDYESYKKQFHLMEEVCKEFEEEKESDSEEVEKSKIYKSFRTYGRDAKIRPTTKDLVGEGAPFGLDENTLAGQIPGLDQSQCSVM